MRRAGSSIWFLPKSLDRISRDQEDIAGLYKRLRFAGVKMITLSEGEIGELHIGFKGTMSALYLKNLAEKTWRGQSGRVRPGKSGGGNCYGYDVVRRSSRRASPSAGERRINEKEAAIVCRIFKEYAAGKSPRAIAHALNKRRHPRSGRQSLGTLHDQRQLAPRHRHPEQRAVYRPTGLEPAALYQEPGYRKACFAPQRYVHIDHHGRA